MKRILLGIIVGGIIAAAASALAGQIVDQGAGNGAKVDWFANTAAHRSCTFSEFIVTNAAGGSTLTVVAGRKAVEFQNNGPNAIWCRLDGGTPTASSAGGRSVAASGGNWSIDLTSVAVIKCIAATAAQVTTAATAVHQCG